MLCVVEKFVSINGEGTRSGELSAFIRFKGCNLSCGYCDTKWANEENAPCTYYTFQELNEWVLNQNVLNVTLTGGEPLLCGEIYQLTELLGESGIRCEIETNGSIPISDSSKLIYRPSFTLDYKLPSSGVYGSFCDDNVNFLQKNDTVKFVCGSAEDLETADEVIRKYSLCDKCYVYLSPVFDSLKPDIMVEFMKKKGLNKVRLQLQIHKFIWSPDERGV